MSADHLGYELGAGTVRGIVKFLAAGIGTKVGFIFHAEEAALVVIEPPGEARVAGVFEVHDGILSPVKFNIEKKLTRPMRQPFVDEIHVRADGLAVKMTEHCRRGQTVKAVIVVINLHSHRLFPTSERTAPLQVSQSGEGPGTLTAIHTRYRKRTGETLKIMEQATIAPIRDQWIDD